MGVIALDLDTDLKERYAFCDPAAGKKAELRGTQCDSAICVVGVDHVGRIFLLHSWSDRVRTDTLIDQVMLVNREWKPRVFGIEGNAIQSAFGDAVQLVLRERGENLPYMSITQPSKIKKEWRIRAALQPVLASGRLIFHESQRKVLKQLSQFPRGRVVDELDALASCVMMVPKRTTQKERDHSADRLAQYLRSRGAPPRYIEERLRRHASKFERGA